MPQKQKQQRLDTGLVIDYVKVRKTFTTDEVAMHFKASRGQAAATIAIMRIKEVVKPAVPKTKNGSSHWTFMGSQAT